MKLFEEIILRVFRTHPNLVFFVLLTAAVVIGYSYRVFAETTDLTALELKHDTEFSLLVRKIEYGFAELKIRTIEGEIFQIESLLQRGEEVGPRDLHRLASLRSDLSSLQRLLQQIERGDEI